MEEHPPTRDCDCETCRKSFDDEIPDWKYYIMNQNEDAIQSVMELYLVTRQDALDHYKDEIDAYVRLKEMGLNDE